MKYRIGSRGSKLALAQSEIVRFTLEHAYPEDEFEIVVISTKGDRNKETPLHKIGDKGLFVKEIELALLNKEIDLAVHSMKDMPSKLVDGLVFTKTWKREDARDVLVLKEGNDLSDLKPHAKIGTGSKRRAYQLLALRDDLEIVPIRGNIETRLAKLEDGYDGIVIAAAGLKRLGKEEMITQYFGVSEMIPACAQGALAIEIREEDVELKAKLDVFGDEISDMCVMGERMFLQSVNGSCHIPVGAYCEKDETGYVMYGVLGNESGNLKTIWKHGSDPKQLGKDCAKQLKQQMGE